MTKASAKEETIELAAAADQLYLLTFLATQDKALDAVKDLLKDKVKIVKEENLGQKTLAFPINKHKELTLISVFFTAENGVIAGIERELKHEEEVERFLLTTWRGDLNDSDRPARRSRFKKEAD